MVLAKALVDQEKEMDKTYDPEKGHILPQIPLHKAREIMTRADFIQSYDHINVFTIDSRAMVRAGMCYSKFSRHSSVHRWLT